MELIDCRNGKPIGESLPGLFGEMTEPDKGE